MITQSEFCSSLISQLKYHYENRVCPAHDLSHSKEMILFGPRIKAIALCQKLNLDEFEVACLIHSTDRSSTLRDIIGFKNGMPPLEFKEKWSDFLYFLLKPGPFDQEAQDRIVNAILHHAKKDDDLKHDSVLLTALRIADKVVRFGALGVWSISANHRDKPMYQQDFPFNYTSTVESKLTSVYNDLCRVLEWYGMLPSDEARALITRENLDFQITFHRAIGKQISEITGIRNDSEDDIKKAMGQYYDRVKIEQ